jgi:hypothetical protein
MREHFWTYDMHDVFTALEWVDPDDIFGQVDLFRDYASVTVEDVARSNEWYHLWATPDTYRQNLLLTYQFFQKNVSEDLSLKRTRLSPSSNREDPFSLSS